MDPIPREEALAFLKDSQVAHIGVVVNGEPYVTPMSFVVDEESILFRTKPGQRFSGLKENPIVSIEVSKFDDETGDWLSVIIRGEATETTDPQLASKTVDMLMDKYRKALGSPFSHGGMQPMAGFPHVVVVKILEITGMASGRGFSMRTRPGRL